MIDGVDEFAATMGVGRAQAVAILRQFPTTAARVDAFTAERQAELSVAQVEALRSLDAIDLADLADEPDPPAALAEMVDRRAEMHLRATIAAHESWAQTDDRSARTAPAREAFERRFEDQVDPERKLDPDDRARRAAHARKAYFARLAFASAKARRLRREGA